MINHTLKKYDQRVSRLENNLQWKGKKNKTKQKYDKTIQHKNTQDKNDSITFC